MQRAKSYIFYVVLFIFCVALSANTTGFDYDLWARLIAGMGFIQTGHVLKQDFLSYTPTHTWYDHEWGSGVVFYLVNNLFPVAGLILLQGIMLFLIYFVITKIIKLKGVKTTTELNLLFYLFSIISLAQVIGNPIRCQMFSYLFFAVFIYILECARKNIKKPLYLLPFLMIIWNNLHGGCVSGLGLIFIYSVGEFLNKAPFKKYLLALLASTAVLIINPWGVEYLKFLLMATTMKRPYVLEWWGAFSPYHMFNFIQYKAFALFFILVEFIKTKREISYAKLDKTKFLLLFTTLLISVQHIKMIPFFVISATIFLYDDFYSLFNQVAQRVSQKISIKNLGLKKDIIVYSIVLFVFLVRVAVGIFEPVINEQRYPYKEIEFLKINNLKGKLLINFGQGSYASYKLYPNNLIYMDGRYEEVYSNDLLVTMRNFYLMDKTALKLLQKYPPDLIVMEKNYPAYLYLSMSKSWKRVYLGEVFGVFVRSKDLKTVYIKPTDDINYYKKTIFDTSIDLSLRKN